METKVFYKTFMEKPGKKLFFSLYIQVQQYEIALKWSLNSL